MVWEAQQSLLSTARPAAVWALWADPDRWSSWNPDIARVKIEGPLEEGSTARIKFHRSGTLRFTVIEMEPERRFVDEARLPGARLGHEHRVEPREDGCEITNRLYFEGPAAGFYGLLLGRRMRRSLPQLLTRERDLAEAGSGPSTGAAPTRGGEPGSRLARARSPRG